MSYAGPGRGIAKTVQTRSPIAWTVFFVHIFPPKVWRENNGGQSKGFRQHRNGRRWYWCKGGGWRSNRKQEIFSSKKHLPCLHHFASSCAQDWILKWNCQIETNMALQNCYTMILYFPQVFRVEMFDLVEVPEEQHGVFFAGDCYVILYAYRFCHFEILNWDKCRSRWVGMVMIRMILKIPTPSFLQRWLEGLLHNLLLARSSLQSGRAGWAKTHQYYLKATICKTWLP